MSASYVFEIGMAVSMLAMMVLGLWHSLATRRLRDTAMLFVLGAGFGYVFPFIDVNLFGQYTFEGSSPWRTCPSTSGWPGTRCFTCR